MKGPWRRERPVEVMYVVRRVDGEPIDGDGLVFLTCDGPEDWSAAPDYAECEDEQVEVEFELLRVDMFPVARRSFPGGG